MSDRLRVACYGTNGHQILDRLAGHPRAVLTAVSEISAPALEEHFGPQSGEDVRSEPDLDALIAADDVDLISLCSPRRDEQFRHAVRCLQGGKHVLAEKPCVLSVEDLQRLQDVMAQCEAKFWPMAACTREALLSAVRELVDCGRLGEVVQVYAHKSYPYFSGRPQDRGIDGGLICQSGIHGVRFIQLATGLRAVRVCGMDTGRGNPGQGDLQMGACVTLELEGGAVASLICNYCNPTGMGFWGNDQLRVHGTGGMVEAVDGFKRTCMALGDGPPQPIPGVPDSYPDFFDSYVAHLLDGAEMPYSLADDLYALRTVIRAQEAVDKGCILAV